MNRRNEPPRRIDQPEPGYFLVRLVRKGPFVPAEIVHKRGLWHATIRGELLGTPHEDWARAPGVARVWTGRRIPKTDYDRLMAELAAPGAPRADRAIDLTSLPPPF